ncbi:EAL domain-containing protein [Halomonas sp. RA08-2]|uniref:bifunctional diguanylate cyclase/phosphodiesterase n=1 Tax=Halomonas sp. RA08-2 TaxID=3440842 RepID=UPI003EEF09A2
MNLTRTRELAMQAYLLLVVCGCVVLGILGVLSSGFGVAIHLGLHPGMAVIGIIASLGIVLVCRGWDWLRYMTACLLMIWLIIIYSPDWLPVASLEWFRYPVRYLLLPAALAFSLFWGRNTPLTQRLWQVTGWLLIGAGLLVLLHPLLPLSMVRTASNMTMPVIEKIGSIALGLAMLLVDRATQKRAVLGRMSELATVIGVIVSCLAGYLVTWQYAQEIPQRPASWPPGMGGVSSPRISDLLPLSITLGGWLLTYSLAISLALTRHTLAHSRDLAATQLQLKLQKQIQAMIARDAPMHESLQAICRMVQHEDDQAGCSVMLFYPRDNALILTASSRLPPAYCEAMQRLSVGPNICACGSAAYYRRLVVTENIDKDPRWHGFRKPATEAGLKACWSYPVVSIEGRLLGTFALYYPYTATLDSERLERLAAAAELVALAVERHQDRQGLKESEQRYRSLFTYNPDAVFSLDLEGSFNSINAACCEITGFHPGSIIGTHFSSFVDKEDSDNVRHIFGESLEGKTRRYEIHAHDVSGNGLVLDVTNLPIVINNEVTGVFGIAKNITEARQRDTQLRILQRSVEASINGIIIADATKEGFPLFYVNSAFEKMTGYRSDEVLGRNCRFLQGERTDKDVIIFMGNRLAEGREVHVTLRNYRKDGAVFWNDLYISPVKDDKDRITHFVGVINDISRQKEHEENLNYNASHDVLTGLANRALFEERLSFALHRARRRSTLISVLFIDLDEFKPINDTLGHDVGDQLLVEVARRMSDQMRPDDLLSRFGGDEFIILLTELEHEEGALQIARRLLPIISSPYHLAGRELHISASIGVACSDGMNLDQPGELVQQADMAMYKAKQQGRNTCQLYTPDINVTLTRRMTLRNELQEAIDWWQFELHYQPLVRVADGEIIGVEALLRWQHPERGLIMPEQFISVAEETGQIVTLSQWVLEQACRDLVTLDRAGWTTWHVAVNLSPLQFRRNDFLSNVLRILADHDLASDRLEVELTEGVLMRDSYSAIETLKGLKRMGVIICIDDFGTGFSSLSYLRHLPIERIKIDRSFIMEVDSNRHDSAIVQGIISIAHQLGLEVVAKGVEREAQRDCLVGFGCDILQGYLMGKPQPLPLLLATLEGATPSLEAAASQGDASAAGSNTGSSEKN